MPRIAGPAGWVRNFIPLANLRAGDGAGGTTGGLVHGTSAITIVGDLVLGFQYRVEKLWVVNNLAITGGPQTLTIKDSAGNTICSLAIASSAGTRAAGYAAYDDADSTYWDISDTGEINFAMAASGTSITAGEATAFLQIMQRPQQR